MHISGLNCDSDGDDILDYVDNCPDTPNPDQADMDEDGIGDVCDDDNDNDGVLDEVDNCVHTYNPNQADKDNDGMGDACDDDDDNDNVLDEVDNCPFTANFDQADLDNDGIGDVCDEDIDGDGVMNEYDNCPDTPNSDQADFDNDGMGDVCDDDDDDDGVLDINDKHQFSNTDSMLILDCYLNIDNMMTRDGTFMNDEIQEVLDLVNAMEDVSDRRRNSKFRYKMYLVVNYWWHKYKLIDSREKRQILNCVYSMEYPFNNYQEE